jgi:hypothetical protein
MSKVSDRWWVLEEAKRRIGEELAAAPLLLHFALAITSTPLTEPIPRPSVVWAKVAARQRNSLTSSTSNEPLLTSSHETKRGNNGHEETPIVAATGPLRLNNNNNGSSMSGSTTPLLTPLTSSSTTPMSFQLSLAGGTLMDSDVCPYGNVLSRAEAHMCLYRIALLRIQARINTFISLLRAEATDTNTTSTNDQRDTAKTPTTLSPMNPQWFIGSSPTIIGPGGELWSLSMFLQCDLYLTACEYARDENFGALECLLLGHAAELSSERLRILSCIPETCSPYRYQHLLPRPNAHPLPSQSPPLFADWVDTRDIIKCILTVHRTLSLKRGAVSIAQMKQRQTQRRRYLSTSASCFTDAALTRWYMERMRVMDAACGQLQVTISPLCDLALSFHVNGLEEFRTLLDDMTHLVYEHDLIDLSLSQYEALDDFGRLCLVLTASRPDTIAQDLKVLQL